MPDDVESDLLKQMRRLSGGFSINQVGLNDFLLESISIGNKQETERNP